jgi:hypothetical protein
MRRHSVSDIWSGSIVVAAAEIHNQLFYLGHSIFKICVQLWCLLSWRLSRSAAW